MSDWKTQQRIDGLAWARLGLATSAHASCNHCPNKYGEFSPNCPLAREHELVRKRHAEKLAARGPDADEEEIRLRVSQGQTDAREYVTNQNASFSDEGY